MVHFKLTFKVTVLVGNNETQRSGWLDTDTQSKWRINNLNNLLIFCSFPGKLYQNRPAAPTSRPPIRLTHRYQKEGPPPRQRGAKLTSSRRTRRRRRRSRRRRRTVRSLSGAEITLSRISQSFSFQKRFLIQRRSIDRVASSSSSMYDWNKFLIIYTFIFWRNTPCFTDSVTSKKSPNVYESCPKMVSLEKWRF